VLHKLQKNISTDGDVMSKIKVVAFFLGHGVYNAYLHGSTEQKCLKCCSDDLLIMCRIVTYILLKLLLKILRCFSYGNISDFDLALG